MICIDPGQAGGLAWEIRGGAAAMKMPESDRELLGLLEALPNHTEQRVGYIETLVKYAGTDMPSSSMAVYACNYGKVIGMMTALHYRIMIVPPKAWQKFLGLGSATGLTRTQWKNKLKQMAEQLYPRLKVTLATADALLILEAARRGGLG